MSLFICSLNSGSNGNCYYVGNGQEAVLIDAGISCRETEKRMLGLGLNISKVRAIFISHEHSDHITGVPVLARKYQIPVYITENTYRLSEIPLDENLVTELQTGVAVNIGALNIIAFSKNHDACDPTSFIVSSNTVKVGIFTDIGRVCRNVITHFKQCHAAFLEANYDEEMLANGRYPYYLKRRITGGNGHLSNTQALQLCLEHRPKFMSHLFLSHLSKENNCPELVRNLFQQHLNNMEIIIASRYEATPLYTIIASGIKKPIAQLSLF
jgi:phosphoribosyl 1,2-cyclic phosphodiesterase